MAGAERLCDIFEGGRELMSYFGVGSRDEKVGNHCCGALERPTLLFVVILIPTLRRTVTLRVSDFTLKCIGVFCCIFECNRKKQST